jgi:serine/threonine protein kinase
LLDKIDYAIKVMPGIKQTRLELYAMASLAISSDEKILKHTVRYFTSWQYKDQLCICMELCRQSLRDFVQKKRAKVTGLQETDIKRALRHACLGLKGLHSQNMVHLDIKPENIMQGINGDFKLGDLGMARIQSPAIEITIPEGDTRYLARELLIE